MEAFSLLKYWRAGTNPKPTTATILDSDAVLRNDTKSDGNDNDLKNDEENDDGPFFDLEFSLDDEEEEEEDEEENKSTKSEEEEDEREFDFALSSGSSNDHRSTDDGDAALLSPSTDSFFTGNLIPVEIPIAADQKQPPIPVSSLLKSATKLRVFMLNGLKKTTSNKATANNYNNATEKLTESNNNNNAGVDSVPAKKFFTVKFKVEEAPIVSLFTRDTSSRAASRQSSDAGDAANAREVVQRYLKKVKPLYVRVSRRNSPAEVPAAEGGETPAPASSAAAIGKGLSFPAGLRVVCKHLGKSRSASAAAAIEAAPATGKRRDDSLMEQQDGIQSAILHCKRSFNAVRDSEATLLSSKCLTRTSSEGIQRA